MRVAVITLEGFNEIDSFVAAHVINRAQGQGIRAEIVCPTEAVSSGNGVRVQAQQPIEFANEADAVLFGSGRLTRTHIEDRALLARLRLDPARQLIAAQCSGALFLARLGLAKTMPVCTDLKTRPVVEAEGVQVLEQTFHAQGNVASAGGCLSAPLLAAWILWRLVGRDAAERALDAVAPVGERERWVKDALDTVGPFIAERAAA